MPVDPVFCAWCQGEAVRGRGGALGHAVRVWRGRDAALELRCRGEGGRVLVVEVRARRGLCTEWAPRWWLEVDALPGGEGSVCVCARARV